MDIPDFVGRVLSRLHDSNYQAYVVGGAVRDNFLRRPVADWDVATDAPPEKIRSLFHDVRNFSLGHGTVSLVHSPGHFEVTTFRGPIDFGHGIKEDLARRDFTINAMAYDVNNEIILDPFGGRGDISKRLVRAVGVPEERFREDPLRLLRAIRIATELGFKVEPNTLGTISSMRRHLGSAAPERIREELMKILMSRVPSTGFHMMARTGLLKEILPELLEGYRKRQNAHHRYTIYKHVMETVDRVESDPVLRLTALLHDIAKPRVRQKRGGEWRFFGHAEASARLAAEIMERLKFSNKMIKNVAHLTGHHMIAYESNWSDGAVRRFIRRVGPEHIPLLFDLRRADISAHGRENRDMGLVSELEKRVKALTKKPLATQREDLAIDGRKVMKILGLSAGPQVGRILHTLMEKVTDCPELNTAPGLSAHVERMKE